MSMNSLTVEAVFENGVLRPIQPLPLASDQRVTVTVQFQTADRPWSDDVAAIYQEIAEEDRRLAAAQPRTT
jgi:predicted DNA-binding antitoxin AbrB/MazE fold protein